MEDERIQTLCDDEPSAKGRYVLYWMQQSQRAHGNHALEHAVRLADEAGQGVVVGFGLMQRYEEANARHFAFLLEGLAETAEALAERGIKLVVRRGRPDRVALDLAGEASQVVCDRGYLRHQRQWRRAVARGAGRRTVQVEGDVVVPVEVASDKREYAARTLRPKLRKRWDDFLGDLTEATPGKSSLPLRVTGDLDPRRQRKNLESLRVDRDVAPVDRFHGGTSRARRLLQRFLRHGLPGYDDARNDPAEPQCSNLSPYLHFGQISPVEVARKARAASGPKQADCDAFLEELIVRRELAANYVFYEPDYDSYQALPEWARKTLAEHEGDDREHRYTRKELERAETHDRWWNAAMLEMRRTGYMHNTMRMYWGKKILEWSNTPGYAYRTALRLNNKYFLDGRDPNSYANVAWLFGLHDRPWGERDVYGKVRSMTAGGLERKFDIEAYAKWAEQLDEGG